MVAFAVRDLPCFVFRPAIKIDPSKAVGIAVFFRRDRIASIAAAIIGIDIGFQGAVVITVLVDKHRERQPGADITCLCRPAKGHAGDGKHMRWQLKQLCNRFDMVTDNTDRATAKAHGLRRLNKKPHHQTSIDRTIKNRVKVVIAEGFSAQCADLPDAAAIGTKNHENRTGA